MAIIKKYSNIDVVTAAKQRIINTFNNKCKIYMSFSGGKDSIVLAHLVYSLIKEDKIDAKQLIVVFVDEEGMYDDVIDIVKDWRKKFLLVGAKFDWYCLEFKHFNCLNTLTDEESWIIWDRNEKENWIRPMPSFAIKYHPLLNCGVDTYQTFLSRITIDGLQLMGVRASESVQRLSNFSRLNKNHISKNRGVFPIFDWKDTDVWLYLKRNRVDYPESYLQMWQVGVGKNRLRISQFFSIDTAASLVRMAEFKPDLMNRINKRQPNAYMAFLYWDSEMFNRRTRNRKKIEQVEDNKDYQVLLRNKIYEILNPKNGYSEAHKKTAEAYKREYMRAVKAHSNNKIFERLYGGLCSGDPKKRTLRSISMDMFSEKNQR